MHANHNPIVKKTYDFALSIVELYKELISLNREFVMSKQLLKSGNSIGANVNEAVAAQSKSDFVHKLSIALKEARETEYWLNLLKDSKYISEEKFRVNSDHNLEVIKILSSIILTTKERYLEEEEANYSTNPMDETPPL